MRGIFLLGTWHGHTFPLSPPLSTTKSPEHHLNTSLRSLRRSEAVWGHVDLWENVVVPCVFQAESKRDQLP